MSNQERTSTHFSLNERVIFEEGSPGRRAFDLPALDVPEKNIHDLINPELLREDIPGMPELSEVDVIRHFTRLSTWNYHIDLGLYPLGSCTMKYNPKINERMARLEDLAFAHRCGRQRGFRALSKSKRLSRIVWPKSAAWTASRCSPPLELTANLPAF